MFNEQMRVHTSVFVFAYLLVVRVKQGRLLTDGTASSISGYDLLNVRVSSGKFVEDL